MSYLREIAYSPGNKPKLPRIYQIAVKNNSTTGGFSPEFFDQLDDCIALILGPSGSWQIVTDGEEIVVVNLFKKHDADRLSTILGLVAQISAGRGPGMSSP